MAQFDSKVDECVPKSEDFAIPIFEHWRLLIHATCPDVEEAINRFQKWLKYLEPKSIIKKTQKYWSN